MELDKQDAKERDSDWSILAGCTGLEQMENTIKVAIS